MTDYFYGVDATGGVTSKPHGFTATGYESLTSNFEFITISTPVDIRTATQPGGSAASQAALDKLIQIVSERGQPVIMGNVAGSAAPFTLLLTIEHPYAWQCTANNVGGATGSVPTATALGLPWPDARVGEDLVTKIKADGINYGFNVAGNTVTFSNVLV
jgi:hypothetical protein